MNATLLYARRALGVTTVAVTCLAAACIYTSRPPRDDRAVRSPLGVYSEIDVGRERYWGELLTVTGTDFVLLTERHAVVIPFAIAGAGAFKSIGVATFRAPGDTHAEQLKYASRYPYGIPPAALDAILRQRGQTSLDTIRPSAR